MVFVDRAGCLLSGSLMSPWLVNDEPLILKWNGSCYFPAFVHYSEKDFGRTYETEPDYPRFIAEAKMENRDVWALMPPIPHDPLKADLSLDGTPPFPPSGDHWLGTDANGRDILPPCSRFRICMSFSLLLTLLARFWEFYRWDSGVFGCWWDTAFQRGIEIWSSLPFLMW
jgi:microcin C transport system permease protein